MEKHTFANLGSEDLLYGHLRYTEPEAAFFQNHRHPMAEILLFRSGEASFVIGGKEYPLKKNDLVFVDSEIWHFIRLTGSAEYERYHLMFRRGILPPSLEETIRSDYKILSLEEGSVLTQLFLKLDRYVEQFPEEAAELLLRQTAIEMMYNITAEKDDAYCGAAESNAFITRALEYINGHLTDIQGIDELCAQLYVSKAHLHRMFQRYLFTSPKRYITERRLLLARQLLYSGEQPLKIYEFCGFADYATFYRSYKKRFGVAPSKEIPSL